MSKQDGSYQLHARRVKRASGWHKLAAGSYDRKKVNPKLILAHCNRLKRAPKLTRDQELAAQAAFIAEHGVKPWAVYDVERAQWGKDVYLRPHEKGRWMEKGMYKKRRRKTTRHVVRGK